MHAKYFSNQDEDVDSTEEQDGWELAGKKCFPFSFSKRGKTKPSSVTAQSSLYFYII